MAPAEFSKFAGILSAALSQHYPLWFGVVKSSARIPSPPICLFLVMFPKAYLTSHSTMYGSRWMITPSWLSGSWRPFLYSSSVYSFHLFLISSASVRSIQFLSFIEPIFAWNVPLVSLIFSKRSLVFPILFFPLSLHWSLRKAFLSFLAILWNSAFRWIYLFFSLLPFSSVQSSHSLVSDSLQPHESQHTKPPCPSPTPRVHSNSCPSSWWCHPHISSSVVPFSSCPQSLPASGSFPMSQHFAWGGQSIAASASASVLPMKPRTDLL